VKGFRPWLLVVAVVALAVGLVEAFGSKSSTTTTTTSDPAIVDLQSVVDLQQMMTALGVYFGPIDGVYGPATVAAVKRIQRGLRVTENGIYGPAIAAFKAAVADGTLRTTTTSTTTARTPTISTATTTTTPPSATTAGTTTTATTSATYDVEDGVPEGAVRL
jgi:peptidoglycan hydrolase-like protein with peptidoglycan-binding domain